MSPFLNSSLAIIFLFCGMAAVFIMLELRGAPKARSINPVLIKLHKFFGWIFTGIFLLMILVMIIKISGYHKEISPRISLHIALSLVLIPLLAVKLIIAHRYPRLSSSLISFGPAVLALAVSLAGITAGYYFLHSSDLKYISLAEFDTQILDAGIGRQIVNQKCNKCHSLERVYRAVKSENGWTTTINRMASLDAPNIASFDIKQAIFFLAGRKKELKDKNEKEFNQAVGKTILTTKCTACHALDRIIQAQKSEKEWKRTVRRMIHHSGESEYLTTKEQKELIDFLINKDHK